jgi:hypothetical protein
MRIFEREVLRRIFEPNRDQVTNYCEDKLYSFVLLA